MATPQSNNQHPLLLCQVLEEEYKQVGVKLAAPESIEELLKQSDVGLFRTLKAALSATANEAIAGKGEANASKNAPSVPNYANLIKQFTGQVQQCLKKYELSEDVKTLHAGTEPPPSSNPSSEAGFPPILLNEFVQVLRKELNRIQLGKLFQHAGKQNLAALCLSGGGIRSATFALGVIQGLARCGLLDKFHYLSTVSGGGYIGSWLTSWVHRQGIEKVTKQLARRDDEDKDDKDPLSGEPQTIKHLREYSNYLSPKLGLLSADTWALIATTLRNLLLNWTVLIPLMIAALILPRFFVAAINNLRLSAQYPWFFLGAVLLGLLSLTYTMVFRPSDGARRESQKTFKKCSSQGGFLRWCLLPLAGSCWLLVLCWAWWRKSESGVDLECLNIPLAPFRGWMNFSFFGLELALVAGICSWFILQKWKAVSEMRSRLINIRGSAAEKRGLIIGETWLLVKELFFLSISGFVGWILIWWIANLFSNAADNPTLFICLAFPLVLATFFLANTLFVGLSSKRTKINGKYKDSVNDDDREWLARFSGWILVVAISWLLISALVLYGPYWLLAFMANSAIKKAIVTAVGGTSGIITWVLGFGSKTAATQKTENAGWRNKTLSLAAPTFVLLLIVTLALGTNWLIFNAAKLPSQATPLNCTPNASTQTTSEPSPASSVEVTETAALTTPPKMSVLDCLSHLYNDPAETSKVSIRLCLRHLLNVDQLDEELQKNGQAFSKDAQAIITRWSSARLLLGLFGAGLGLGIIMGFFINVNRFSLHALYRNRLIRAYLGASRKNRSPNPFTGFDPNDNLLMHELRGLCRCLNGHVMKAGASQCDECGQPASRERCDGHSINPHKQYRLLHIVNMALNLVHGENLAWQERKAESFTASPFHCGNSEVGYRDAKEFGEGVSLGTAMAISGAAVSPNMGYHSSPVVSFILTLFNIRLGWWFGNPKDEKTFGRAHPKFSVRPIIDEALGLTDDDNPYIYLSDGGHFENLGLYEMVLRRCKYIVVSDAGCDSDFKFDDLGNAIRKIRIDLGVQITMNPKINILSRADKKVGVYCALGEIEYPEANSNTTNADEKKGWLIYLKPAFYGDREPMDVVNFAKTCDTFPHETTADQFFSETQFESYRKLGLYAVQQLSQNKPFADFEVLKKAVETYLKPPTSAP